MLITSHFFLLYFFPLFISIYYAFSKKIKAQNILIIFASLIFYASFGIENIPILIAPLLLDYFLGIKIYETKKQKRKKYFLIAGIIFNIALLGYFKYSHFLSTNLLFILPASHLLNSLQSNIIAPVGISFITFQRISYLGDIYRKKITPSRKFFEYATYACLFPHLISGPIVRFSDIKEALGKRIINSLSVFEASKFFTIGLAAKILIADQLFTVEELYTGSQLTNHLLQSIILIFSFTFRIYADFFGYSLMAIGLAKFMGFNFPKNFNSPYQSTSITDFWRRWNITLSNWIRDYLYIPLGGNRKGTLRTYINLFITMFLAGLWHGASWNFVLWGSLHGVYLITEKIFMKKKIFFTNSKIIHIFYTFSLVTITWIAFKFTTTSDLTTFIHSLGKISLIQFSQHEQNILLPAIPAFIIALIWSFFIQDSLIDKIKPSKIMMIFLIMLFIFSLWFSLIRRDIPFIYFQF